MTTAQNNSVPTGQGAATPEQPLQAQETTPLGQPAENAQEKTQPQFVTKEDLAAFGNQLAKQLKQSAKDRDNRIEGEINNLRKKLEAAGLQITPQQEAALRTQISEEVETTEFENDPEHGTPDNAPPSLDAFTADILEPFGVTVNPNSPHFPALNKVLQETWNDPNAGGIVTKALIKYGKAEAERIANQQTNADARVIGQGGGAPSNVSADTPASNLWKQAYTNR